MPEYIQNYCPQKHQRLLLWRFKVALKNIRFGALALGEKHRQPYARALVCDLIEAGAVKKLFLEIASIPYMVEVGKALRGELLGTDITEAELWTQLRFNLKILNAQFRNPIPFATLIQLAVRRRVEVYFFDCPEEREPTSEAGMQRRNAVMGKAFRESSDAAEAGALILIGCKHFERSASGHLFKHTILYTCGIPFSHTLDFGLQKLDEPIILQSDDDSDGNYSDGYDSDSDGSN